MSGSLSVRATRRDKTAVDFIIETCKANPGQITLITLGPLTNVAQALIQCPELPQYVKRIGTRVVPRGSRVCRVVCRVCRLTLFFYCRVQCRWAAC